MTLAKGSLSINWHIAITTACGAAVVWRRFRGGGGGGGGGGNGRNSEFVFSPLGIGREAIGRRGGGETFYYCFSPLRGGGGGREQDQLHMLLCLISMLFGAFCMAISELPFNVVFIFHGLFLFDCSTWRILINRQ